MQVVDRLVEVQAPTIEVIREVEREVAVTPKGAAWAPALHELARQLDRGQVYNRDLDDLAEALQAVLTALQRRPALRYRRW